MVAVFSNPSRAFRGPQAVGSCASPAKQRDHWLGGIRESEILPPCPFLVSGTLPSLAVDSAEEACPRAQLSCFAGQPR